ncbi:AMP-binding protein [Chromohalobacter japonicus]|uniref:AMP-binding protein n=1 Tax=Chromohalobacter japonicus TaxID=223900 RepID=UPI001FF17131|nr:AMP-binding protein [Chromohalobacter japonicus]MCK0754347.1 AMP-binding protein [Chromohalobacter japonicus]
MSLFDYNPIYSSPDIISKWTVPKLVSERAAKSSGSLFVKEINGKEETYGKFIHNSKILSSFLYKTGVQPGERVAILANNSIPALHAWLAANLLGAIDVSINTGLRGQPLKHVLNASSPKIIIIDSELVGSLAELEDGITRLETLLILDDRNDIDLTKTWLGRLSIARYTEAIEKFNFEQIDFPVVRPSDIASVIFTSGTTGPAKGVMMPHAHVCLLALQTIYEARINESDVYYSVHPLFHIAGKFMGVLAILAAGGKLILDKKFDATSWLDNICDNKATISIAHGPMIEMIYAQGPRKADQENSLTRLLCCPLPKGIGKEFVERFNVYPIEMWGMSEIGCPCWTSQQDRFIPGSCGRVLSGWYEVMIIDPRDDSPVPSGEVGEIVVRPKHPWTMMTGYIGMPEETVKSWKNLWFHTGDLAYQDDEGNIFFIDRKGDRIRRRSENISSYEIESAARKYSNIKDCAAIGVPSAYESDDDIMLYIVSQPGIRIVPEELLGFLANNLPHYMVPRYIEAVSELPRTQTNKVKKGELRLRGFNDNTWDRKSAGIDLKELFDKFKHPPH